jgi:hypothetical protein
MALRSRIFQELEVQVLSILITLGIFVGTISIGLLLLGIVRRFMGG